MADKIATVIVDAHIEKELDYLIPMHLQGKIFPGMRVKIPLRSSQQEGFVFAIKETTSIKNLKEILQISSEEVFDEKLMQIALWMSSYYAAPLSKVMKFLIPTGIRKKIQPKFHIYLRSTKTKKELIKICSDLQRTAPSQAKVLEVILRIKKQISLQDLLFLSQVSPQPIEALVEKKILTKIKIIADETQILKDQHFFPTVAKTLTQEQKNCFDKITQDITNQQYNCHLLFGITGSGKTEIYLQSMAQALEQNKSIIVLVPEISLTSQTIERFRCRFPKEEIAILHHRRSHGEKYDAWHKIQKEKARIIIGARSAIFCPTPHLGLIIIDEEHDTSYKQSEEMPCYHAKHVAIMRAKIHNCPIILGSATPSLESFYLAKKGVYELSILKQRPTQTSLAKVHIIDMVEERKKNNSFSIFSSYLLNAIEKRYAKGEQTLLFLNRRGYHSYLICNQCSTTIKCPHCDVSLTFHKKEKILLCHSCSYYQSPPKICPSCQTASYIQYKGFGTELVQSALHAIFPNIRTMRMDRDTTRQKDSHDTLFKSFRSGKADVLIGTQMIVKGLHFPSVTLVGVLNSDSALHIPDFRSSEYVFQLITQVAGRSGRCQLEGEVVIQSYMPDNPTIRLSAEQNYEAFYQEEIHNRKLFHYPPFTRLAKFTFIGNEEKTTCAAAQNYRKNLIELLPHDFHIHPVVASGKIKIQDKYRFLFLVRGKKSIGTYLTKIQKKLLSSVHLLIDIDPTHTFV